MAQTLTLTFPTVPAIGAKTFTFAIPESTSLADIVKLDGGSIEGTATVTESGNGISLSASMNAPWGPESVSFDIPLGGIAKSAADELLALNGGTLTASAEVTN